MGYELSNGYYIPFSLDLTTHPHWLVVGGSGSGKSVFLLYVLSQLKGTDLSLYLADFKGSGDFVGITTNYAEFGECTALMEEFYLRFQEIKTKKTSEKILLVFDEMPSFFLWLEGQDKKKAAESKSKLAEVLMQGRALSGGGSAWIWTVCQRADASYFSNGSRENFMATIGFGRLSRESKTMMGFSADEIPEGYDSSAGTGKALVSADGRPLTVLQVPKIENLDNLKNSLKK